MAGKAKFEKGPLIRDPLELIAAILSGHWVYWPTDDRPINPLIMKNMSVAVLEHAARYHGLHLAVRKDDA